MNKAELDQDIWDLLQGTGEGEEEKEEEEEEEEKKEEEEEEEASVKNKEANSPHISAAESSSSSSDEDVSSSSVEEEEDEEGSLKNKHRWLDQKSTKPTNHPLTGEKCPQQVSYLCWYITFLLIVLPKPETPKVLLVPDSQPSAMDTQSPLTAKPKPPVPIDLDDAGASAMDIEAADADIGPSTPSASSQRSQQWWSKGPQHAKAWNEIVPLLNGLLAGKNKLHGGKASHYLHGSIMEATKKQLDVADVSAHLCDDGIGFYLTMDPQCLGSALAAIANQASGLKNYTWLCFVW